MREAIGAGMGKDFDVTQSNYKKIIIMTDADDDGSHIQVLLITFFWHFMRDLFKEKMIYIAKPPLFKITYDKNKVHYTWSVAETKDFTAKLKGKYELQQLKP